MIKEISTENSKLIENNNNLYLTEVISPKTVGGRITLGIDNSEIESACNAVKSGSAVVPVNTTTGDKVQLKVENLSRTSVNGVQVIGLLSLGALVGATLAVTGQYLYMKYQYKKMAKKLEKMNPISPTE